MVKSTETFVMYTIQIGFKMKKCTAILFNYIILLDVLHRFYPIDFKICRPVGRVVILYCDNVCRNPPKLIWKSQYYVFFPHRKP